MRVQWHNKDGINGMSGLATDHSTRPQPRKLLIQNCTANPEQSTQMARSLRSATMARPAPWTGVTIVSMAALPHQDTGRHKIGM